MKKIRPLLAILLITTFANAEESISRIEGAFGISLGQTFEPANAIGESALTDGTKMYQFSPEKPFRSFKRYYVLITPKTNKVYSIWGLGDFENTPTAKKEQALIMEILKNKYGEKEKEGFMDSLSDVKRVDHGDRSILVKISGMVDITMDIRYYDDELRNLAEEERLQIEAAKVDSSGL
jgi:hypothetical protein